MWYFYVLVGVIGYLLGGINFATLFAKLNKKNIRDMGSGNPGTMNVMRNLGAKWGALTFVCDGLKGAIPALLGNYLLGAEGLYCGGLSSVVGHCYPIYTKFKGGKGVATSIGVFVVANPLWSLIAFGILIVVLLVSEYSSLSSMTFVTVLVVEQGVEFMGKNLAVSIMLFAIWLLVVFGHRKNIANLIAGKERKSRILKVLSKIKKKEGKEE
ncbi:MAG: glycerol-3-phosphate 1-O-acyltransferase PlsY [Clostridia bacterium]|nr:glycerol-3-phosphate 1-O-acyltransferase PlsY [Clostridia bacterium]